MRLGVVRLSSCSNQYSCLLACNPSSVKAYGELPENAKINETDAFGEEDGECTFEFGEDEEVDIDEI